MKGALRLQRGEACAPHQVPLFLTSRESSSVAATSSSWQWDKSTIFALQPCVRANWTTSPQPTRVIGLPAGGREGAGM